MTCRELTDFLADYLVGDMSETQRCAFEHHLAVCGPCVAYLETYKRTIELSKAALTDDEVSGATRAQQMPEELVRAILNARLEAPG